MNEQKWLSECDDPGQMLGHLHDLWVQSNYNGVSPRKLRLFVASACRQSVFRTHSPEIRALLALEALADEGSGDTEVILSQVWASSMVRFPRPNIAMGTVTGAWMHAQLMGDPPITKEQRAIRCFFLREIFGNPFRPVTLPRTKAQVLEQRRHLVMGGCCNRFADQMACDCLQKAPASIPWMKWRNGIVPSTARHIYEDRCWDEMGVLGDMLEEAGCEDVEILNHCRGMKREVCQRCDGDGKAHGSDRPFEWSPDPDYMKCPICKGSGAGGWVKSDVSHCRGCWAIDLLLGKG